MLLLILGICLPSTLAQWTELGVGVAYRDYGYGTNVLITYAGWSVSDTLARHWADRLVSHSPLRSLNVGKVYAVKGPNDSLYRAQEIGNSKLISHLLSNQTPRMIIVAAHSSGAFVANEFFHQLYDRNMDSSQKTYHKIVYFNLDGAGGLSSTARGKLKKEYFVYAKFGSLYSRNANTMRSLGHGTQLIELDGSTSQCRHYNCLHDVMIIQHPWNPMTFDLIRDYGLFSLGDREVQFGYIKHVQGELSALA